MRRRTLLKFSSKTNAHRITPLLATRLIPNICLLLQATAVGICAQRGLEAGLKLLIDAGADFKKAGVTGAGPLHLAAWFGRKGTVKMLLDAGCEVDAQDNNGKIPLDFAREGAKNFTPDAVLNSKKVEKILKEAACKGEGGGASKKKKKKKKANKSASGGGMSKDGSSKERKSLPRMT